MSRARRDEARVGLAATVAAAAAVVAFADVAAAHDVGGRFDAPVPLGGLFLGAGATVALTAAWLGQSGDAVPNGTRTAGRLSGRTVRTLRAVGRVAFGGFVAFVVFRGIAGRQVAAENAATVFVWPLWLKGVGLLAMLVGSPWRALSPWRGLHSLLETLEGGRASLRAYPDAWGVWPAVVGFVAAVGVVENLTVIPGSPRFTAGLVALYAAAMVLGGVAFGRTWFRRADFFEVLYRQFGRVAPVRVRRRGDGYAVEFRAPWTGCTAPAAESGTLAFVVAMVYSVSFDGFTNTPEYRGLLFPVRDALGTGPLTGVLLYVAGFAAFVLGFVAAAAAVERSGRAAASARETARAFAPTVVPIAAGYELAHNYPFVVRNLARAVELLLRAAGEAATVSLLDWLSLPAFWTSQVLLVVLGHVVAVVAAHEVAVGRYGSPARARRAHLPLVAVMVGYTVLSLWIVSRPVVSG